ncbi:ankyrin repeat domain-containing protein [Aciduricibacillus chroicocephali]|uniref:Ankyrin repeat domain-containing protein n=1 Tax=Aciduricibacillus chroicocephali TaxID=3054939 RepID=A0ABY9KXB9_9BACI|nr:ankyrin repeat domain-containing protein [Bacillaceae bacterium 44XB]
MYFKHINRLMMILVFSLIMAACQKQGIIDQTNDDTNEESREKQTVKDSNENERRSKEMKNKASNYLDGSLLKAVKDGNPELVRSILESADYQVDEKNGKGETPLLIAVHNNSVKISKMLIDHGADINEQDDILDSPYLYAGALGRTEILKYMLEKATPDETKFNRYGGNAIIPAAEKGHLENVKLLLEKSKSDVNHQNDFGYTALIEAVALTDGSTVYQDIVQVLLDGGANPNLKDNNGKTALDYAQELNYTEMEQILLKYR